jgi:hypothetical protein
MVYFIEGEQTKRIKIGKADDVMTRLRMMQCGSPDRLTVLKVVTERVSDVVHLSERLYHLQFALDRIHGEWFKPSADLMAFIDSIPSSKFDGLTCVTEYVNLDQPCAPTRCLTWRWSGKIRHARPCSCVERVYERLCSPAI